MRRGRFLLLSLVALIFLRAGQDPDPHTTSFLKADPAAEAWADSLLHTLSIDQKIGQLFMIRAHSDRGEEHVRQVQQAIREFGVGGLCFFQGTPQEQVRLTNAYQEISAIPLMVSMDAEWGTGMRLRKDGFSFPYQLGLGAIQENRLLYDMGKEVARQLKSLGVHVNLAPVVDINNNPANPVINYRSFGEDKLNVSAKAFLYMKGMQDNGVMACAKHFPGHGDTDTDSHVDLPVIRHDRNRLREVEMYPFEALIRQGIGGIMVAHMFVPALDSTPELPTTLSTKVVTGLLKEDLGFQGLVFTDGLEMQGVTRDHAPGEIEVKCLQAGNDVLLLPPDLEKAMAAIRAALAEGRLSETAIEEKVRKILVAKYRLGLDNKPAPLPEVRPENLKNPEAKALNRQLVRQSLTLVRNEDQLLPFSDLGSIQMASLSLGSVDTTAFQRSLSRYFPMEHYFHKRIIYSDDKRDLVRELRDKDLVIVGLHSMSQWKRDEFGITTSTVDFLKQLRKHTRVVLVVFGNPYSLERVKDHQWLVCAYEDNTENQDLAAQALFGAFGFRGKLPVTACEEFPVHTGIQTAGFGRLGYGIPAEVGMDASVLSGIDSIAYEAIERKATPGCVVLVARNGQVIYHKAFGYQTYEDAYPVRPDDIFDLASVTKIAATTLSVMDLEDKGLISVEQPLSQYLIDLDTTNKKDITVEEVLTHHAGLLSWMPFYKNTMTASRRNPQPLSTLYRKSLSVGYSIPVANNLFLRNDYERDIWQQILTSRMHPQKRYRYSDLGFYMLSELVECMTGERLDAYADNHFYRSLGLQTMGFNPWKRYDKSRIVPTEVDRYFRRQKVHGFVHDSGAALLGGVSGHAGLFSNANDLAILMQLFLNKGAYGGKRYFHPEVVERFTRRCEGCTRRGLGFDMQQLDPSRDSNLPEEASDQTFGHIGFTGTAAWADPDQQLTYIFLSNRTYPSSRNYQINELKIRERIHQVIYRSITEQEPKP